MKPTRLKLDGHDYVILSRTEFDQLSRLARVGKLPPLPSPDARGNYPAAEYARTSIARTIIHERTRLGLSQRELARLAGVRVETLCRIETGKHTASTASVAKLDRALKGATKRNRPRKGA